MSEHDPWRSTEASGEVGDDGLSDRQRSEQAERLAVVGDYEPAPKRGMLRRKRYWLAFGVLALLLVTALLPTIAGPIAKPRLESMLSDALGSKVRIGAVRLSWLGSQSVSDLRIMDSSLQEVVDVSVVADRSLFGLLRDRTDLGVVTLSGRATLERRADGSISPFPPDDGTDKPSSGPLRLPTDLRAAVRLSGFDLTFLEDDGSEISITGLTGELSTQIDAQQSGLAATLTGDAGSGQRHGTIALDATVASFIATDGELAPDSATAELSLGIENLPTAILAWLAGDAAESLGDSVTLRLGAAGSLAEGSATVMLDAANASADLKASFASIEDGFRVNATQPGRVRLEPAMVARFAPDLAALTQNPVTLDSGEAFSLDAVPGMALAVRRFSLPMDSDGAKIRWAEASVEATAAIDGLSGALDGQRWAIEPLDLVASSIRLGAGASLSGATTATLAGDLAGILAVSANGLSPVTDDGRWATTPAAVLASGRASIEANDVRAEIIGPLMARFLEPAGLVLERDLGPTFSVEASVSTDPQPTLLAFVESANVRGRTGVILNDGVLTTDAGGIRLTVDSAAGVLTRLLNDSGIAIEQGASLDATVRDLTIDADAFETGKAFDLRRLAGLADLSIGATTVRLPQDGGEGLLVDTAPAVLRADLRELAQGASLSGTLAATVEGQPAGDLVVSVRAVDLIDAHGALRPGVPPIEGEITARDLLVPLATPWLPKTVADAAPAFGDRITIQLTGRRNAEDVVEITTQVSSSAMRGGGAMEIRDRVFSVVDDGLTITLDNPGSLASRMMPALSATANGGQAELHITRARFGGPEGRTVTPALDARLTLNGVNWLGATGDTLLVERAGLVLGLESGSATVEVNASASHAGNPMLAAGRLQFPALLTEDGRFEPLASKPSGRVDLTGLPVTLVGAFMDLTKSDPRPLIEDLIGSTVDVAIVAQNGDIELTTTGSTPALTGEIRAAMGEGALTIKGGSAQIAVDPDTLRQARLADLQSGETGGILLATPAELSLTFEGFGLATGHAWRPSGEPEVRLSASAVLKGVQFAAASESAASPANQPTGNDSGEIGVDGLTFVGRIPIGAIVGGQDAPLTATVRGTLIGAASDAIGRVDGELTAGLVAGALEGDVALSIGLDALDFGAIDETLRTDSMFAGALGATGQLSLVLVGGAHAGQITDAKLVGTVTTPRLTTDQPMRLSIQDDRIVLEEPATLRWQLDPAFATQHLLGQEIGNEEARLAKPAAVTIAMDRLQLARGTTPLRPDVFDIVARADIPAIVFEHVIEPGVHNGVPMPADRQWATTRYAPVEFSVAVESGRVLLTRAAAVGEAGDRIDLNARVIGFADESGTVSLGNATFDGTIEAMRTPSVLVDAALNMHGWFSEIMGPTINARFDAQSMSSASGKINASITGDRASARLIGEIVDGVFSAVEPINAEVSQIRPQLGQRLSRVVPALGQITKRVEDGPGLVTITGVSLPLGDEVPVAGFDADFTVDIGTARFSTGSAFSELLKIAQQRTDGEVGRRVEPMVGTVRDGRLSYKQFKIPLGEFTLLSEGSYDLVSKRIGVTTYIPIGALTDKAMGILNTGLASQFSRIIPGLERLTMIPWKVSGTPGSLTVQPDFDAITRDLTNLLNPVNLIGGVFKGVRSGLGMGG